MVGFNWTLRTATYEGDLDFVQMEIATDGGVHSDTGTFALIVAAEAGQDHIIEWLVQAGVDVNIQYRYKSTALIYAAGNEQLTTVNLLLDHGALPNLRAHLGVTALMPAVRWNKIHARRCGNNIPVALVLVARGADPTLYDDGGKNVLMWAADGGNVDLLSIFPWDKIDINSQDKDGYTALHYAVERHRTAMVQALIERHPDLSLPNNEGRTAADIARTNRSEDILAALGSV